MLTYSLVDRGTVLITGLDVQTGDKAKFQGEYYSDKLPGFSFLSTVPYAVTKKLLGIPPHPLNEKKARNYWVGDYWITLFTSGILTACTGALIVFWSRCLGCRPASAALLGLGYGLATPAYVYATLANGHQTAAFGLFTSFFLLWNGGPGRRSWLNFVAGFLAAYAAVVDLYVGPVSAILAFYLMFQCVRRVRPFDDLAVFCVGAIIPTLILLGYNQLAFGSPWQMGYFHHATREFAEVHNARNPLGLAVPESITGRVSSLLWGRHRGLTFYAPLLLLTVPGWIALLARRGGEWNRGRREALAGEGGGGSCGSAGASPSREFGAAEGGARMLGTAGASPSRGVDGTISVALVSFLVVASVFVVNVFYPEWTGGWSTGPRLLVPLLPFAVLPIAGLLSGDTRVSGVATWIALFLAIAGGIEMLLFQGVDGRVPHDIADPLVTAVWPTWAGRILPPWRFGEQFCRNLTVIAVPDWVAGMSPRWRGVQFLPLLLFQIAGVIGLWRFGLDGHRNTSGKQSKARADAGARSAKDSVLHLSVDQQQESGRDRQQSEDAEAQANRA
jgi:hypothetical protein